MFTGGEWLCCSDYAEVFRSLGEPVRFSDGETGPDVLTVCLEQVPGQARPHVMLVHGEDADRAELTITEAMQLAVALMRAAAAAVDDGQAFPAA